MKLAALSCLEYEDVWKLFGLGKHPSFKKLLTSQLAPYLSQHAYNYWISRSYYFESPKGIESLYKPSYGGLYSHGGSGLCISIFNLIIKATGLSFAINSLLDDVYTLEKQYKIWTEKIKPVLFHPWIVTLLNNRYLYFKF